MIAVVIVAGVLFCGAVALLCWHPWLTSFGISTEPKHAEETPADSERAA